MNSYTYSIPIDGKLRTFTHAEKAMVLTMVMDVLRENNISFNVHDLSASIERQSRARQLQIPEKKQPVTLAKAIAGAKALVRYSTAGAVPKEEMLRRAAICRGCPLLESTGGCKPCGAAGAVAKFVNTMRTSLKLEEPIPGDLKSKYCGFCQCSIPLLIVSKLSDFYPETPEKNSKRPDRCWLKNQI